MMSLSWFERCVVCGIKIHIQHAFRTKDGWKCRAHAFYPNHHFEWSKDK